MAPSGMAPHCSDKGPDFCLRRSIGAHDAEKYNYCISSHAEVNAVNQSSGILGTVQKTLPCIVQLEPCNWCFKQLIQAGIREIYFESPYDSKNRDFDLFWRQVMETHKEIRVFEQISISDQAKELMIQTLLDDSTRRLIATDPSETTQLEEDALSQFLKN